MITDSEGMQILAAASVHDEREPSVVQARGWAAAMNHLEITLEEAIEAVHRWYIANPDDRIRPGHIGPVVQEMRAQAYRERRRIERDAERQAIQAQMGPPPPVRDRTEDVQALVSGLMDRYRNWPETGDPDMRRRQREWSPELAQRADAASRAKARAIVAASRAQRTPDAQVVDQDDAMIRPAGTDQ